MNPIESAVNEFFKELAYRKLPTNMYDLMVVHLEKALIVNVLKSVRGNQVRASEVLGINRNTLRKRCAQYRIKCCDYYIGQTRQYIHNEVTI